MESELPKEHQLWKHGCYETSCCSYKSDNLRHGKEPTSGMDAEIESQTGG